MTVVVELIKRVLKESSCRLTGRGNYKCFKSNSGTKLRGVTTRLSHLVFSNGTFPQAALKSDVPAGGHWRGEGGGRRRGIAVDRQVTKLASVSRARRLGRFTSQSLEKENAVESKA